MRGLSFEWMLRRRWLALALSDWVDDREPISCVAPKVEQEAFNRDG